jgi:hypothetical protein
VNPSAAGLSLRAVDQIRRSVLEAKTVLAAGPSVANMPLLHRNATERLERALRLSDALMANLRRLAEGDVAGEAFAPEPPAIIGPEIPQGGDARVAYLRDHPEYAIAAAAAAAAPPESRSIEDIVAEAVAKALAGSPVVAAVAPMAAHVQQATAEQHAAYLDAERALARQPEPEPYVPQLTSDDELDALLGDDDLISALETGSASARPTWAGERPRGAGPDWVPPGHIPPGAPIPPVPSTFTPFDGAQLTRDEVARVEAAVAAANPGAPFRPLPAVAPGVAEDDPAAYEAALARAQVAIPTPSTAPDVAPEDPAEARAAVEASVGGLEPHPAEGQALDNGEVVPPCPECGKQCGKWVGLHGHASAAHGFTGKRPALKEWARRSGASSSSAA